MKGETRDRAVWDTEEGKGREDDSKLSEYHDIQIRGHQVVLTPRPCAEGATPDTAFYEPLLQTIPLGIDSSETSMDRFDGRLLLDSIHAPATFSHPDPRVYAGDENESSDLLDELQHERWVDLMFTTQRLHAEADAEQQRLQDEEEKERNRRQGNEFNFQYDSGREGSDDKRGVKSGGGGQESSLRPPSHLARPATLQQYIIMDRTARFIVTHDGMTDTRGDAEDRLMSSVLVSPSEMALRNGYAKEIPALAFLEPGNELYSYFRFQVKVLRLHGDSVIYEPTTDADTVKNIIEGADVSPIRKRRRLAMAKASDLIHEHGIDIDDVSNPVTASAISTPLLSFLLPWSEHHAEFKSILEGAAKKS